MNEIHEVSSDRGASDRAPAGLRGKGFLLLDVLQTVLRYRVLLLIVLILSSVISVTMALLSEPMYRASVVVVPSSTEGQGSMAASLLGQLSGLAAIGGIDLQAQNANIEESIAVLQSREFNERFITAKNLLPVLFHSRWNPDTQSWRGEESKWPTVASGARFFDREVRAVIRDRKTGLFRIQITWSDPGLAAAWANDLVDMLNAEMRTRAIVRSGEYIAYLEKELAATNVVTTKEAIGRLLEHQIRQKMLANVSEQFAFRVVERAMPPERDDYLRLPRLLLLVGGPVAGLLICCLLIIAASVLRLWRATIAQ